MSTLEERIIALENKIDGYEVQLNKAIVDGNDDDKKLFANLITAARNNLDKLLIQQNQSSPVQSQQQLSIFSEVFIPLCNGIPELKKILRDSNPSVPPGNLHSPCERIITNFPYLPDLPDSTLRFPGYRNTPNLTYATEASIAHIVRTYLEAIISSMKLQITFEGELSIKRIRPDISAILYEQYLVGVVETKKPGKNILNEPTVLGELLDQMLLVEGFYGMGPAIGILTTGEEWLISWFSEDHQIIANYDNNHETSCITPRKQNPSESKTSPPGNTPSQKSTLPHQINENEEITSLNLTENDELREEMSRNLNTTEVMNIYSDPIVVLQHLYAAFQVMAASTMLNRKNISHCLLKFHKEEAKVTFHPANYEDVFKKVNFNRFPNKNTKTLVALEDLGRGASGKAWLCATVSNQNASCCVLKFHNKNDESQLQLEEANWHDIYPEFADKIKVEKWSGSYALKMPHFAEVPVNERRNYLEGVRQTLTNKFLFRQKVHRDVKWRNLGLYSHLGEIVVVVFDLDRVSDQNDNDFNWVEKAIQHLEETCEMDQIVIPGLKL